VGGLLGAWWLAQSLQYLLFGVNPHDPVTFAGVGAVLGFVSLLAVAVPAYRAMRIDPDAALRAE